VSAPVAPSLAAPPGDPIGSPRPGSGAAKKAAFSYR
jgi:hypothetical protein